ncbi:hypothetical protein QU481_17835 [Crenobacter sp. SG2303]|uniref:Uncharacterized protein n=1 Tax=Crenobacter oryzisoli TaxID=3056844 RepID=A0ABT7XSF3_9NEIS|nr:hypothetical protein [Crenobacter sp. SG2303]MDN0076722.1 hypothetical protein [Crenobacter sp. SG2303]
MSTAARRGFRSRVEDLLIWTIKVIILVVVHQLIHGQGPMF